MYSPQRPRTIGSGGEPGVLHRVQGRSVGELLRESPATDSESDVAGAQLGQAAGATICKCLTFPAFRQCFAIRRFTLAWPGCRSVPAAAVGREAARMGPADWRTGKGGRVV